MEALGLYLHVPYCVRKCRYCDFCSHVPENNDEVAAYFDSLRIEIMKAAFVYRNQYYVDTIFFGGGTPSLVPAAELTRTLDCIRQNWRVDAGAEISLEANPGTLTEEKLRMYRAAGFNRISLGVQSLDDGVLQALGRIHDAQTARDALSLIRSVGGFDCNVDLMFGVPEQTPEIWKRTLAELISLRPEHISFYSLQLEEGTPLYADYRRGAVELPTWEENRTMYRSALELLKASGYAHYEISNAALPGHECRHNLKYWHMQPYLGFGESAWSFIGGQRGEAGSLHRESDAELKGDFIFTELRLIEGFALSDYRDLFGADFEAEHAGVLHDLKEDGLIEIAGGKVKFTEKGLDFTNPVMERLLNDE